MKKIILTLLTAIAALSVDAQIIEVYKKDGQPTPTNIFDSSYKVKFREKSSETNTSGSAKKKDNNDQNWVQLWAGGPRFAIVNVSTKQQAPIGSDPVTVAWGPNWRTPTLDEMVQLVTKCTRSYNTNKVTITGTESYTGNSITLDVDAISNPPTGGRTWTGTYWTSTLADGSRRFVLKLDDPVSDPDIIVDYWLNVMNTTSTSTCYLLAVLKE